MAGSNSEKEHEIVYGLEQISLSQTQDFTGFSNTPVAVDDGKILEHIRTLQRKGNIKPSDSLDSHFNLTIEMETVVGKTYTYTPVMPLEVCTTMSQGYIGYHIQQGLSHALAARGRQVPVVTLITQVVVAKDDPAFLNPSKLPYFKRKMARSMAWMQ